MKKIVVFVFTVIAISCSNHKEKITDQNKLILGNWQAPLYEEDITTFVRGTGSVENGNGITFKEGGIFVDKNTGWCATEPTSEAISTGVWSLKDGLVEITMDSFQNNFGWRIVSVTKDILVVKRESTPQEIAYGTLVKHYGEVYALAYSKKCKNAADWKFTPYGSNACGGPVGYMAYSTKIDTVALFNKIATYNMAEAAFNKKWSITSNCIEMEAPQSIECQNESAYLIY